MHHHTGSVVPTLTLKNLNIQVCLCTAGNTSTVLPHLAPGKTFSSSVYAQHNDVLSHLLTSPGTFTLILLCGFTFLPRSLHCHTPSDGRSAGTLQLQSDLRAPHAVTSMPSSYADTPDPLLDAAPVYTYTESTGTSHSPPIGLTRPTTGKRGRS